MSAEADHQRAELYRRRLAAAAAAHNRPLALFQALADLLAANPPGKYAAARALVALIERAAREAPTETP